MQYAHLQAHPIRKPQHHQGAAKSNTASCCWHRLLIRLAGEMNRVEMNRVVTGARDRKREEKEIAQGDNYEEQQNEKTKMGEVKQKQVEHETKKREI